MSKKFNLAEKDGLLLKLSTNLSKLFFVMKAIRKMLRLEYFCLLLCSRVFWGYKIWGYSPPMGSIIDINGSCDVINPLDQKLGGFFFLRMVTYQRKEYILHLSGLFDFKTSYLQSVNIVLF